MESIKYQKEINLIIENIKMYNELISLNKSLELSQIENKKEFLSKWLDTVISYSNKALNNNKIIKDKIMDDVSKLNKNKKNDLNYELNKNIKTDALFLNKNIIENSLILEIACIDMFDRERKIYERDFQLINSIIGISLNKNLIKIIEDSFLCDCLSIHKNIFHIKKKYLINQDVTFDYLIEGLNLIEDCNFYLNIVDEAQVEGTIFDRINKLSNYQIEGFENKDILNIYIISSILLLIIISIQNSIF